MLGFELLRQRFESSPVARDEHEVVAALGEQPGELLTDSGRGAGDKGDWLS